MPPMDTPPFTRRVDASVVDGKTRVRVLDHQLDGDARGLDRPVARVVRACDEEAGFFRGCGEALDRSASARAGIETVEDRETRAGNKIAGATGGGVVGGDEERVTLAG